jgi:energy-coupling factor transporter ATPase
MQPLISVNGLHFSYRDGSGHNISALKNVDLTIQEGEFIAIIGANGSGKSTLARHFNGLLLPTQGDVLVGGIPTRDANGWRDLRRKIAMVFQHPESQAVATTIEDDVAFGPENLGVPQIEIRQRVNWALDIVGLGGMEKRAPHHLSGGQKQRLALAGVLAMQPSCIILDEATSMLDPSGRRGFREIIQRLHAQGVTIVMITQDMDEATMAERVIVLSHGQLVRDDKSRTIMTDEVYLQSVGLDTPLITRLARELHAFRPVFPDNLLTGAEIVEQIGRLANPGATNKSNNFEAISSLTNNQIGNLSTPHPIPEGHDRHGKFIEARNLGYTYMRGTPLETEALRGVNFNLELGEIIGIIGATGSGKSTLLQHLNGLLTPQSGELRIANSDLTKNHPDLRAIRQQVALLFQQPEDQLFEQYVADDIAYGPINLGLPLDEVRKRVEQAMEAAGLPFEVFRDRSIFSLSGGERRRAALAGVLALEPKVLVLDEPTAGLDPRGRRNLLDLLRHWQGQDQRSVVWASHSMDEIAQVAGRVCVLAGGRVTLEGNPRQVFHQSEALASFGLDIPQVLQVMKGVEHIGLHVPGDVFTFEEAIPALTRLLS